MLSFFRKKSANDPLDGIVAAVKQLSTGTDSVRIESSSGDETMDSLELAKQLGYGSLVELKETIYGIYHTFGIGLLFSSCNIIKIYFSDCLRTIKDPEKPQTLEDLNVVYEEGIFVKTPTQDNINVVSLIHFVMPYHHCFSY